MSQYVCQFTGCRYHTLNPGWCWRHARHIQKEDVKRMLPTYRKYENAKRAWMALVIKELDAVNAGIAKSTGKKP